MASGKGNNQAIGLLSLIFQAVVSADWATLALNATSSPATSLYISLHNANPGATGTQATSETAYTNYARVGVVRTTSGWAISGETIDNIAAINFPACGASGDTLTYIGIGTNATAGQAGILLYFGALTSSLAVSNGITPSVAAAALTVTEA
jgi:hypothetical protein